MSISIFLFRECQKLGTSGWVSVTLMATECFIVMKFDWPLLMQPLPIHMSIFWVVFIVILVGWTIWHFYINRHWHTGLPSTKAMTMDDKHKSKGRYAKDKHKQLNSDDTPKRRNAESQRTRSKKAN